MNTLRMRAAAGSRLEASARFPRAVRPSVVPPMAHLATNKAVRLQGIQRVSNPDLPFYRPHTPARPMRKVAAGAVQGGGEVQVAEKQITLYRRAKVLVKKNQRGITAFINGGIVLGVAAGASYNLLQVDWDIARGWTMAEFLAATATDDFVAYQLAAASDPFFTKACTSGVAYLLGDFAAQTFQGRTMFDLDLTRTLRSGIAGFCIHGPLCHLWIEWMEANLSFDGAWYSTFVKVFADQTGWSIFLNTMYTSTILGLQGKGPSVIKEEVKATWWPAISSGWRFWPFVHMISFSPYVPTDLKLLFIDTMEIIWVTILATVVNRKERETTPVLSCSIESGAAASMPYASIEITKKNQYQPVIEKDDGTTELVVLDEEARAELQDMSDAADAAYLLESMQEDGDEPLDEQLQAIKTTEAAGIADEMLPSWDEDSPVILDISRVDPLSANVERKA